jgi:hypothetical protein
MMDEKTSERIKMRAMLTIAGGAGAVLGGAADSKGYNDALFEVTRELPHPLGEIVYKVIRYSKQRNIGDLEKIVAWAELEYRYAKAGGSSGRSEPRTEPSWAFIAGPRKSSVDSGEGMLGGITGGALIGEAPPAVCPACHIPIEPTSGTCPSCSRSFPMGTKYR